MKVPRTSKIHGNDLKEKLNTWRTPNFLKIRTPKLYFFENLLKILTSTKNLKILNKMPFLTKNHKKSIFYVRITDSLASYAKIDSFIVFIGQF